MLTAAQTMKIKQLLSTTNDKNVKLCVLKKTCMKLNLFSSNNETLETDYKDWKNHRDVDWDNYKNGGGDDWPNYEKCDYN